MKPSVVIAYPISEAERDAILKRWLPLGFEITFVGSIKEAATYTFESFLAIRPHATQGIDGTSKQLKRRKQ